MANVSTEVSIVMNDPRQKDREREREKKKSNLNRLSITYSAAVSELHTIILAGMGCHELDLIQNGTIMISKTHR